MMAMEPNELDQLDEQLVQVDLKLKRKLKKKRIEIIISSLIVLVLITLNQGQKLFLFDFMSETAETDGLRTLFSTKVIGYLIYGFLLMILLLSLFIPSFIKDDMKPALLKKWYDFFDLVGVIPVFLAIVVLINAFFFSPAIVHGPSMETTFYEGDIVIIYLNPKSYDKEDVVIYDRGDALLIKRIMAVPGDELVVDATGVYINGVNMNLEGIELQYHFYNGVIPQGSYFLVGDNDPHSNDSRYFGLILEKDLLGEVVVAFDGRS